MTDNRLIYQIGSPWEDISPGKRLVVFTWSRGGLVIYETEKERLSELALIAYALDGRTVWHQLENLEARANNAGIPLRRIHFHRMQDLPGSIY